MNRITLTTIASLAGLALPIACASQPAADVKRPARSAPTTPVAIADADVAHADAAVPIMASTGGDGAPERPAAEQPATRPAGLPAGHPDISAMMAAKKEQQQPKAADAAVPGSPKL